MKKLNYYLSDFINLLINKSLYLLCHHQIEKKVNIIKRKIN